MKLFRHFTYVVLLIGLTACGGPGKPPHQEVKPVSLESQLLGDSSLLLGFTNQIRWHDSVIYLWDLNGKQHLSALSYPDLQPVVSFCQRGKGPEEMVNIVRFDISGDELFVLADRYPKVLVYSLSGLKKGVSKPVRMISLPTETMPAFAFVVTTGGELILSGASQTDRIHVADTTGRLISHRAVPYPVAEEELALVDKEMLPYLWCSDMDYDNGHLAITTRLGDVLEIHPTVNDSQSEQRVVVGDDGAPAIDNDGTLGRVEGYLDVRIVGDKVYAIYSGFPSEEVNRILDEGGNPPTGGKILRVFDLNTGELLRVYQLDRNVSTFDILPDGKTVVAADPNVEQQLCTFTLPD